MGTSRIVQARTALVSAALLATVACFPDPATEPPASTTTTTEATTTTTAASQPQLVGAVQGNAGSTVGESYAATFVVNNLGDGTATGVTVDIEFSPDWVYESSEPGFTPDPGGGGGTWSPGTIAGNDSADITVIVWRNEAGNDNSLAMTAHADGQPDASALTTVGVAKAPLGVQITPDPANPPVVDIVSPDPLKWTAEATGNRAGAPVAQVSWTCETGSGGPCPPAMALWTPGMTVLEMNSRDLMIDTYTLTAYAVSNDPRYEGPATATVSFTTVADGA